ncbi:MAG: hypothetical protein ACJAWC_002793, partial [Yoonia sp.]
SNIKPDCEEKRDPDERHRPKTNKEKELDLNTQLEKRIFAASAKSKEQREESGRSGHQPVFSVVQTRRMAAVSPVYSVPHHSIY